MYHALLLAFGSRAQRRFLALTDTIAYRSPSGLVKEGQAGINLMPSSGGTLWADSLSLGRRCSGAGGGSAGGHPVFLAAAAFPVPGVAVQRGLHAGQLRDAAQV